MDFGNTSGIRSPFSPRVRQSLTGRKSMGLSSIKKNQNKFIASVENQTGEVIHKTQFNTIECFGLPPPVMVTETLTFANAQVTIKFSSIGWCWLVCGRKLLVWQFQEVKHTSGRGSTTTCRELTLPQTDLAHKAGLVCVFFADGNQMPSCVGVSPEGVVRYWPSVAHEGTYVDESADLQGQECDRLSDLTPAGLVLATTTCTIVLVQPEHTDGRHTVTTRTLRAPSGWLGGLGRKVSLLFFGSMPAQMVETRLVGLAVLETRAFAGEEEGEGGGCVCIVACGPCLQLWRLAASSERLLHEAELRRPLRDAFAHTQMFPQVFAGDAGTIDVFVLDMQTSGNGLLLLVAAVNLTRSPDMRYALAQITLEENPPSRVTAFVPLQRTAKFRDEPDSDAMSLRFLNVGNRAYLYNQRQLVIVSSTIPNDKPDFVDMNNDGDRILGGEVCFGLPLFFTKKNGIISVKPNDYSPADTSICDSPIGSPCPSEMYDGHLSLYEIDPHEVSMVTTDACGKLKTAFLYHLRRDAVACRNIVEELFPSPAPADPPSPRRQTSAGLYPALSTSLLEESEEQDVDAVLDRTVVNIATEMLDDVPAGDPRWTQTSGMSTNIPLGSSAALQIATQLRDKQRALNLFVDFLRATGLWHRLGYVSKENTGGAISARALLAQLPERLAAASALRRLQQGTYAHVIDTAIHQVINAEDADSCELEEALNSGTLSPSDLFYKRVTGVGRVFRAVQRWCEEQAASDAAADSVARLLYNANQVLLGVLQEIHKCRNQNSSLLLVPGLPESDLGSVATWTGELGSKGLLTALTKQQKLTIVGGARQCTEATLRGQLYDQAVALAEFILTDATYLLRSSHTQHTYERLRHDAIQLFIEDEQVDRASILAEKFKDFDQLILMCTKSDNLDKLYGYMEKYENEGLMEHTFAWLAERGGEQAARLVRAVGSRYGARLRAWLAAVPARRSLLWLHELGEQRWAPAADALLQLADDETECVSRMTTMASLAKLCLLVSEEGSEEWGAALSAVERRLALAEQHVGLPRDVLLHHGLDDANSDSMRVYAPTELIHMYTSTKSSSLSEYDFKKALDLTDLIEDEVERSIQKQRVWCAAILLDDWSRYRADAPLEAVRDKLFFKLVDLVLLMGGDLEEQLPPVEDILSAPELSGIASDKGFQFILKYGYEYVDRQHSEDMIDS